MITGVQDISLNMREIQDLAKRLEVLQVDCNKKYWTQYTTGFDFGVDEAQKKINDIYLEKDSFQIICRALDCDLNEADRRRVEIMHRDFRPFHQSEKANAIKEKMDALEIKLGDLLNKNRAVLDGREVTSAEISRILSENPDRELRKRAYLSRTQINRKLVDAGFLDLISLRKEHATACGASDFITHSLEQDDLSPSLFAGWNELLSSYRSSYRTIMSKFAECYLDCDEFYPWDELYLENRISSRNRHKVDLSEFRAVLSKAFRANGFEIDGLSITYDVFARENKSEWGYMFIIQPCKDSRIIANMDNRFSSYWTLMHESAHAVHFLGLNPEERILNRGLSGIVAEGFANFFGDLCYSREFLSQFFSSPEKDETEDALQDFSSLKSLYDLNGILLIADTLFDHELYRRDLKSLNDINDLAWSMRRDSLYDQQKNCEPQWGHTIHHTTAPIYLHNYFLGDVMCWSMKRTFAKKTGASWSDRPQDFGRMWKDEVLAPSGLYPFSDLFERITGERPNIAAYFESVVKTAETTISSRSDSRVSL